MKFPCKNCITWPICKYIIRNFVHVDFETEQQNDRSVQKFMDLEKKCEKIKNFTDFIGRTSDTVTEFDYILETEIKKVEQYD